MNKSFKLLIIILILLSLGIWMAVLSAPPKNLKVISCNVGQGDATLIIYKNIDILIDGGPDNKVLGCLSSYMPFWDREIEVIILTHPQADHYTGLISVIERYKVGNILANSLDSGNQSYEVLKKSILSHGVDVVNPVAGMGIRYNMIYIDILHPTERFLAENLAIKEGDFAYLNTQPNVLGASDSKLDPNEFSIVALMRFGSFKFLFTGDTSARVLDTLGTTLSENGESSINYIKIPHHGSKTALSEEFYNSIDIDMAAIPVGRNSYGHPNEEILKLLKDKGIKVYRTDQDGDIVTVTDGKKMWVD